jgi:hypothetical protein
VGASLTEGLVGTLAKQLLCISLSFCTPVWQGDEKIVAVV